MIDAERIIWKKKLLWTSVGTRRYWLLGPKLTSSNGHIFSDTHSEPGAVGDAYRKVLIATPIPEIFFPTGTGVRRARVS
jgi:hypothetical protein